ncbi:MAG: hypothetical protein Q9214_005327 [Letrouitia sp. 1 TL-2023]
MADGLLQIRQADIPISTMTEDGIDAPRDMLPAIVPRGIILPTTKSGFESYVTLLPQVIQPDVVTDKTTHARTHTSTSTLSMVQQVMQTSTSSSAPSSAPVQHNRLTSGKLAAVIVVPLIVMAIASPILIVWLLSWRRRRRSQRRRTSRRGCSDPPLMQYHKQQHSSSRHHSSNRASKRSRAVPRPSPTYSSFNFGLPRVDSMRATKVGRRPLPDGPRSQHSLVCPWDAEAPPPYTTTTHIIAHPTPQTTRSQSPIPRIDTPIFPDSPLLETAQIVHIRPISHQSPLRNNQQPRRHQSDTLQPPDTYGNIHTRQDSSESEFSVHNRATLRQPFSPMASPTFSDVSGLSFDPTLWASVIYGRDSIISPIDVDDQDASKERTSPHQIV